MTPKSSFVAKSPGNSNRQGVTRLELTLVAFLILVVLSLISMGLLRARESAREQLCLKRLVSLAKAVNEYGETHGSYPGFVNESPESQTHSISWVAAILPHLSDRLPTIATNSEGWEVKEMQAQEPIEAAPLKYPWPDWKKAQKVQLPLLLCPSENTDRLAPGNSSYVASCGYPDAVRAGRPDFAANGIFLDLRHLPPLTERSVHERDGTEFTLLLTENVQSGSWDSPQEAGTGFVWTERLTGAALPKKAGIPEILAFNQGLQGKADGYKTARPSSRHAGGVHAVFANTRLRKIANNIDPAVYIRLCSVDDTAMTNPWTKIRIGPPIGREASIPSGNR